MARLRILQWGLALTFLVLITPNSASKEDACRATCRRGRSNNFRYEEGTTYKYNFNSAIKISLASVKGQESITHIKATALLTPNSPCTHLLRLQNVEIIGANQQRFSHIAGIEKPIQLTFEDGRIGDHICTEADDVHNSLNIKRAVASLFQVDTERADETDVFGVCPTVGTVSSDGRDTLVTKVRDLDECAFRESIREDFMVASFNPDSDIKTSPIMSGEYMSQQRIKDGIVDRALVFENYTYLAFTESDGSDDLGALAKVATRLEYAGTSREYAPQTRLDVPKSIIFDNPHPVYNTDRSNIDSILEAVKKLRGEIDVAVSETSARDFLDLVKILRDSNQADMLAVFRQVKAGAGFRDRDAARRMFLDALFRCGTGNAIVASIELLKSRELQPHEEQLVYLGFAFVKHATLSSLEAATSLLQTKNLPREAYLGIGNLAGRYCRQHDCNVDAVNRLTQQLASKLTWGRVHSRDEENEIIYVLKALGNIQHLDEGILSKISVIVNDKPSPTRLRAAALDTYLSDPCHQGVRSTSAAVLKDIQEDSELRIKAYLVLAKCPNEEVARVIRTVLNAEPSHQVGGFIVSHLRNLKASANPDKQHAQHYLGGISTNKKFPIDPRKYSFNGEFSYDLVGVSSSTEANVIYSQNSFLPRSTSLNLTAELFGHTINFLEVGTRQQNLDQLLEYYFGPVGVFNKITLDDVKIAGVFAPMTLQVIIDKFKERLDKSQMRRGRRDVSKSEIDDFARQVHIRTNELNNELDLDLSIKLFGSELFFLTATDDTHNLSLDDLVDLVFDSYERDLADARGFDKNYQSSTLFLDTEFSYPTSMGFPLRLSVEGTSTAQVKTRGSIDLPALLSDSPNGGVFKLSFIPSANIEVAASITLDAQLIESGLKVVSNLYTATAGDLEVNMQDRNKGLDVKYSLPLKNQKLISATHEVVFNTRELAKPEQIQPLRFVQNKDLNVCLNDLVPFIGLNLCADLNSPTGSNKDQSYILAGNYKFSLGLINEDFSHLHLREEYHDDYRKTGGELVAEIIGAGQTQKMSISLEAYSIPEMYVKASVVSPISTASIEGRITDTPNERSASYEIVQDNQRYNGKIGVIGTGSPGRLRFTPILEYKIPGAYGQQRSPVSLQGAFSVEEHGEHDTKVTFEDLKLHLEDPTSRGRGQTYSINGHIGQDPQDYYADITVSDGHLTEQVVGRVHLQRNLIKFDGKFLDRQRPDSNLHVIYEFKRHPEEMDSILTLIHGRDLNSQRNKLTISSSLMSKRPYEYDWEVEAKNEITYPAENLDLQLDYKASPLYVVYAAEFKYDRILFGSELDIKHSQRNEGDYNVDFRAYDTDDEIELKMVREFNGDQIRLENVLVVNKDKYELSGTVTVRVWNDDEADVTTEMQLMLPSVRQPLRVQGEHTYTRQQKTGLVKISDSYAEYVNLNFRSGPDGDNADLKVAIQDELNIKGQMRQTRGTGNAEFTVDLPRSRQTIKADSSYTIADPTYNFRTTLYPDFQRNRGQYYGLKSDNQIRTGSIDSKNTFDVSGQKLQVNAGYAETEHDDDGTVTAHLDVTTPDGDFASGKYNFAYSERDGLLNGGQSIDLVGRGFYDWRNAKLSVKEVMKNVDVDEETFDYTYTVDADDGEGGTAHAVVFGKRSLQGDDVHEAVGVKAYGNREGDGYEIKLSAKHNDDEITGSYDGLVAYQGRYSLNIDGKYDLGGFSDDDSPLTEEISILLKTPDPDLRNVKLTAAITLGDGRDDDIIDEYLDIKASGGLAVNDEGDWGRRDQSINVKGEAVIHVGSDDGEIKLTATSHNEPVTMTINYDYDETETSLMLDSHLEILFNQYKKVRSDLKIDIPNPHECNVDLNIGTPQRPSTKIEFKGKESEDGKVYKSQTFITSENNRYEIIEEVDLRDSSPMINLQVTYPNRKVDQILLRAKLENPRKIEGEVKVHVIERNIHLDSRLDAEVASLEDFNVKLTANWPGLEIHDFILEIQNRGFGTSPAAPPSHLENRYGGDYDRRNRYRRSVDHSYGDSRYGYPDQRNRPQDYYARQDRYGRPEHQDAYDRPRYQEPNRYEPHRTPPPVHNRYGESGPSQSSQGELIHITAQNAGRNLLSGSASYVLRETADGFTLEGGGTFTYKQERPRSHTYKITGNSGYGGRGRGNVVDYTWNVKADADELDGRLKLSEEEFGFATSLCQQRSQCVSLQLDSAVIISDAANFDIRQTIISDLRLLNGHAMGLTEKISMKAGNLDASGEFYVDSTNKYQYKAFSNDRAFGASFTTPWRVVALDGKLQEAWGGRPGPSSVEIDFYLNKQHQPHQKTSFITSYDCRGGSDVGRCNVELKLTNPALQKDLSVVYTANYNYPNLVAEYNLVLDVFKHANNKIVFTGKAAAKKLGREGASATMLYEVKSQGLDIDIKYEENLFFDPSYARELKYDYSVRYHVGRATYDSAFKLHANPQQALLLLKVLNRDVLSIDSQFSSRGDTSTSVTNVRMLATAPSTTTVDVTGRSIKLSVARTNNPSEKVEFLASAFAGVILDLSVKYYERGRPINLVTTYLKVNDRDELDAVYEFDRHSIKRLLVEPSKAELANFRRELGQIKEGAERDLSAQAQQVDRIAEWDLVDLRPMTQYYRSELLAMKRELENDRPLQDVLRTLDELLVPLVRGLADLEARAEAANRQAQEKLNRQYAKLVESYERELKPWLRDNAERLEAAIEESLIETEQLVYAIIDEISDFLDRHHKEIKEYGGYIVESLEEAIVFAVKLEREIERELTEELGKLYREIKDLAVFEELEKWTQAASEGRPVPESYIQELREAVARVKDSTESPAIRNFITVTGHYVEQKLRRQPVDDYVEIQKILYAAYDVVYEIYDILDGDDGDDDDDELGMSWEAIYAIPKLIQAELSPLTYLLEGDWPELDELLDSASLDLDDLRLPEDLDAIIAQGQHIFTFDGKHLTFPGNCDYLLARDIVNGNFSIVGSYRNGQLSSLTFTDTEDTVTLTNDGRVLMNQAPSELPLRKHHRLEVRRTYESFVIWSHYGVQIVCGPELFVCGFHISGYYHAQLRGLLGNGNNEPYDDFTMPNGMIVSNEGEFGNAYGIGGRCPSVRTVDHRERRRAPSCNRLFGAGSSLSNCYSFIDPENYRTACDHGVAAGIQRTEMATAVAYVAACQTKDIPIDVPEGFLTCTNYEKPVRVGEEFTVTTPRGAADIVIIVDQDRDNEPIFRELLQPLTSQLTSSLARLGINDVDFHVIGYGGEFERHPTHYTVDGKLSFKGGRTPNVQFTKPRREDSRESFLEYLERLQDEVELLTGQDMLTEAYSEALSYPFRSHALKSILVFNSKPCAEAEIEPLQALGALLLLDKQFTVNLFTPFKGMNQHDQQTSNIVGFGEHKVYTFSKPEGAKESHTIESDNLCVEFALKNRGNVYVVNNFVQSRSKTQFVQIAADSIAKKLSHMEQWLDCTCEMVTPYTAQNVCEVSYQRKREAAPQRQQYPPRNSYHY